jgi:plasmid replication initiation protein
MGIKRGGNSDDNLDNLLETFSNTNINLKIKTDDKTRQFYSFHWFEEVNYDKEKRLIYLSFSNQLVEYLKSIKYHYTNLNLKEMGEIQSDYGTRFYAIIMDWKTAEGHYGNKPGMFTIPFGIDQLKEEFEIPSEKYKRRNDFIQYIVTVPLREVNNVVKAFDVDYEKTYKGLPIAKGKRKYDGINIICTRTQGKKLIEKKCDQLLVKIGKRKKASSRSLPLKGQKQA